MNKPLFIIGLAIAVFSHPKVMGFVMRRLINERIVPAKKVTREEGEVIRHAGPNLSLFFIGIVLMIISIILGN